MKQIILFLFILISITGYSQKKVLIADETHAISYSTGSLRIITSNDSITKLLISKFSGRIKNFSQSLKKDRSGYYYENSFSFSKEVRNDVVDFFNKLNYGK